jgi:arginine kinase
LKIKEKKMSHSNKISLTQKYLPTDCWTWLSKKTSFGTTALDCCNSALENPDSNVGLYAPGIFIN